MIDYTLSALSERIDTSFLTASLLPAFVAVAGNLALFTMLVGPDALAAWLYDLTSFQEIIVTVIILVVIMMVAILLRALSFVTAGFFVGELLPRSVASWSTRRQQRARRRAQRLFGDANSSSVPPLRDKVRDLVSQRYPQDETALRPTRFGNTLAAGAEYPWNIYGMDGLLWWSHLSPLLPSYVSDPLNGAQARVLGLLNLGLVFGVVAGEAVVVLGLVGQQWTAALGVAIVGGVLAWLGYQAAVSQALEVTSQIRVAFNLFRQEILKQMGLAVPKTVAEERALWQRLTEELLGQASDAAPISQRTKTAAAANG